MFWKYLIAIFKAAFPALITLIFLYLIGEVIAGKKFKNAVDSERALITGTCSNEISNTIFYGIAYIVMFAIGLSWGNTIFRWVAIILTAFLILDNLRSWIVCIVTTVGVSKGSRAMELCYLLPGAYGIYIWVIFEINLLRNFYII